MTALRLHLDPGPTRQRLQQARRPQDGGRALAGPHGGHVRNRFEAARHRNSEGSLDPCDLPRPLLSSPQLSIGMTIPLAGLLTVLAMLLVGMTLTEQHAAHMFGRE